MKLITDLGKIVFYIYQTMLFQVQHIKQVYMFIEQSNYFRLFTHYSPDKRFGCGVRTGATVVLYHVHLICKLGQVSVDFMLKINYHTSFDFCRSTTRNSWEKSSTIRLQDSTLDGFFSAVAGWNSDTHQGIRGPNFAPVSLS
jgi:hypothetical protein